MMWTVQDVRPGTCPGPAPADGRTPPARTAGPGLGRGCGNPGGDEDLGRRGARRHWRGGRGEGSEGIAGALAVAFIGSPGSDHSTRPGRARGRRSAPRRGQATAGSSPPHPAPGDRRRSARWCWRGRWEGLGKRYGDPRVAVYSAVKPGRPAVRPPVGGQGEGRQVRRDDDGFAVERAAGVGGQRARRSGSGRRGAWPWRGRRQRRDLPGGRGVGRWVRAAGC